MQYFRLRFQEEGEGLPISFFIMLALNLRTQQPWRGRGRGGPPGLLATAAPEQEQVFMEMCIWG